MKRTKDPITRSIHNLVKLDGERLKFVPPVMFLKVENKDPKSGSRAYTIVHTNDHTNVLFLLMSPKEETIQEITFLFLKVFMELS